MDSFALRTQFHLVPKQIFAVEIDSSLSLCVPFVSVMTPVLFFRLSAGDCAAENVEQHIAMHFPGAIASIWARFNVSSAANIPNNEVN